MKLETVSSVLQKIQEINPYGSEEATAEAQLCCSVNENPMTCLSRLQTAPVMVPAYNPSTLEECAGDAEFRVGLYSTARLPQEKRERLEE